MINTLVRNIHTHTHTHAHVHSMVNTLHNIHTHTHTHNTHTHEHTNTLLRTSQRRPVNIDSQEEKKFTFLGTFLLLFEIKKANIKI